MYILSWTVPWASSIPLGHWKGQSSRVFFSHQNKGLGYTIWQELLLTCDLLFNQYHIYLFERILLCCKDVNPNKQKTKLMGKDKPNAAPKGKPRLQLKGRIYMANVTEVLSVQKPG